MYSYFFCTNIGLYKVVSPFAPVITAMQIVQMIFGMVVLVSVAFYASTSTRQMVGGPEGGQSWETGYDSEACYVDGANLKMGLAMYFSYFVLFALFFWDKYCTKKPHTTNKTEKKTK
jgi:hypothetical protein